MYDIHCHILYGVDDGADSVRESVRMAELAFEEGTNGIVVTPHCNIPESYENYWDIPLRERIRSFKSALKENDIPIEVYTGQEIFCTGRALSLLKEGKLVTLNDSRYPLLEFDFYEFSTSVYRKLQQFLAEGFVPVVAHPERYAFVNEDDSAAMRLKEMGCLLQVNKGSLNGRFGEDAMNSVHNMLDHRLADFVASDAHSPYMRTPAMSETHEMISELYSADYADFLLEDNPSLVINNKDVMTY